MVNGPRGPKSLFIGLLNASANVCLKRFKYLEDIERLEYSKR